MVPQSLPPAPQLSVTFFLFTIPSEAIVCQHIPFTELRPSILSPRQRGFTVMKMSFPSNLPPRPLFLRRLPRENSSESRIKPFYLLYHAQPQSSEVFLPLIRFRPLVRESFRTTFFMPPPYLGPFLATYLVFRDFFFFFSPPPASTG